MRKKILVAGAVITVIGFIMMLVGSIVFSASTDSSEDEQEDAGMWALIIIVLIGCILFFLGIAVGLVGLVLRRKGPPEMQQPYMPQNQRFCSNCGKAVPFDARMCPYCGNSFEQYAAPSKKIKYCTQCGFELAPSDKFCVECGSEVEI